MEFNVGAICDLTRRQWPIRASFSLSRYRDERRYEEKITSLSGWVDGCKTETITAKLISADTETTRMDGATGEVVDLRDELRKRIAKEQIEHEEKRRLAGEETDRKAELKKQQDETKLAARVRAAAAAASARSAETKRNADLAAARAVGLSRLPLLNSGAQAVFLGSDRKCAQQFQDAVAMEGLEKRKRIADLITYGCGFVAQSPVRVVLLQRDGGFAKVTLGDGKDEGKSGWVPAAWLE